VARVRKPEQKRLRVRVSDRSDPWIVWTVILLVLVGAVFVLDTTYFISQEQYGSHYWMLTKHLVSVSLGAVAMFALSRLRSDRLQRSALWILVFGLVLLPIPLLPGVGVCSNGACRWISLGLFNIQPGELIKVAFVVFAAAFLTARADKVRNWRYGLLPTLAVASLIGGLLLLEPDFGTAVVVALVAGVMLFLIGVPFVQVGGLAALAAAAGGLLVWAEPYRFKRFVGFLDPWADVHGSGYQLAQSFRAFGSGELFGVGMGASRQKAGWLPEAHTDFIYSVIGEETGLVGASLVLICFALLAYRGFRIAHRHPDTFGQMLAAGLTFMITMQAVFNICVTLGLLPTKGMVLPFLSYGGSAMLVTLAMVGMLMSLSRELRER